jgi:hypothetical protein
MAFSVISCGNENTPEEGDKSFTFEVYSASGEVETFTVRTSREKVGEALVDEGLILGEEGPYGLMVHEVNGERHVYEEDGKYWAFYVDGEYAMTGVDSTKITEGAVYAFKAE